MSTPPTKPTPAPFRPLLRSPHTTERRCRSVLVQGPPGEGKTHFITTWPNVFVMVFDPNTATHDRLGVPYAIVRDWAEVDRFWLRALKERRLTELVRSIEADDGSHPYADFTVQTLAVDSVTFMLSKTVLELSKGATKDMGYEGWDKYYSRIYQLLDAALEATKPDPRRPDAECYHFVASVHEANQTDDDGKLKAILPAVQGRMISHFTSFFDAQFLTSVRSESGKRTYWISPVGDAIRKSKGDTVGGLMKAIPNTYQALAEAWGWKDQ